MSVVDDKNHELCKALWFENEPRIRRLCEYKLSSCLSETDDIVADTFLYLWKAIDSGNVPDNPGGWLYSVANNLIKKKYKENKIKSTRMIRFDDSTEEKYGLSVGYNIDDERIPDRLIETLSDEIVENLKDDEKELFYLVYEKKLKLKEVADKLNSTESAVKQKKYRLNRKIKKTVKNYLEKL